MSTCLVWAWLTTYWFIRVRIRPNSWPSAKLCDDAMVSCCFCLCCVPDGWLYKTMNINNLPAHIEQSSSHYDIYIFKSYKKDLFLNYFWSCRDDVCYTHTSYTYLLSQCISFLVLSTHVYLYLIIISGLSLFTRKFLNRAANSEFTHHHTWTVL